MAGSEGQGSKNLRTMSFVLFALAVVAAVVAVVTGNALIPALVALLLVLVGLYFYRRSTK